MSEKNTDVRSDEGDVESMADDENDFLLDDLEIVEDTEVWTRGERIREKTFGSSSVF